MYGIKNWTSVKPIGNGPTYYYELEMSYKVMLPADGNSQF